MERRASLPLTLKNGESVRAVWGQRAFQSVLSATSVPEFFKGLKGAAVAGRHVHLLLQGSLLLLGLVVSSKT